MDEIKSVESIGSVKSVSRVSNVPEINGKEKKKSPEELELERVAMVVYHETSGLRELSFSVENDNTINNLLIINNLYEARCKMAGIIYVVGHDRVAKPKKNKEGDPVGSAIFNECFAAARNKMVPSKKEFNYVLLPMENGIILEDPNIRVDRWVYESKHLITSIYGPFYDSENKIKRYIFFFTGVNNGKTRDKKSEEKRAKLFEEEKLKK